jgi:arginine-tRNA-protein transferase
VKHEERLRLLGRAIADAGIPAGEPYPCPYLAGRSARQLNVLPRPLAPGTYHALMDLNFRRLGPIFYRPACADCAECRMIRIPVAEFRRSRSQRRSWERNADLVVAVGAPRPSDEKHRLYARYLDARHDGQMDGSTEEFLGFLYSSPMETQEVTYSAAGRLLAVGIFDLEPAALSAVYCYFEPTAGGRSLGVYNILWLLEECRRRGADHLYLGYYVKDCQRMRYKADYLPCEILEPGGRWRRLPGA